MPNVSMMIRIVSHVIVACTVAAAMLAAGWGCAGESTESVGITDAAPITIQGQKPLTADLVREMAARRVEDPKLVRSVTIADARDGKSVIFEVVRPAACHDGALVGNVATFSQKTMSALFKYPEVSSVAVIMYGTTEDPASNNEVAIKVSVDRATAGKLDWFSVSDLNMSTMFTTFYIDPRISANWQVEGGDSTPRSQQAHGASTDSGM